LQENKITRLQENKITKKGEWEMRKVLSFVLLVLCLAVLQVQAADHPNQTTVKIADNAKFEVWKVGPFTMTDSTGNYFSEAIPIGGKNVTDGFISIRHANIAGTEDLDVTLLYDYQSRYYSQATAAPLDTNGLRQITGGTTANDTLGFANHADELFFHNSSFMWVKCDGQSGNPQITVTIYVWLNKP